MITTINAITGGGCGGDRPTASSWGCCLLNQLVAQIARQFTVRRQPVTDNNGLAWLTAVTLSFRFVSNCHLVYKRRQIECNMLAICVSLHSWGLFGAMRSNLAWLSTVCILVIFLFKSKVVKHLCHFAVKWLSCTNYLTIAGGISEFLFQFYEFLAGSLI